MATGSYGVSLSVGGVAINKQVTRTGDHPNVYEITVPVATAVTGWVKTDANTAAGNVANGHSLTNGTYDVYWNSGAAKRLGVAVIVTVDALAFEGGAGDDFPANATNSVITQQRVAINSQIDGDTSEIVGVCLEYTDAASTKRGHLTLQDAGNASVAAINLAANVPQVWDIDGGATNIFTGNAITHGTITHDDVTNTATLKILSLEDSTP